MTKTSTTSAGYSVGPRGVLWGVSYEAYVALRDDPRNGHIRMTYHDGVLEIMSPEFRHERGARRLSMIVNAYTAVCGVGCVGTRSTTFRRGLPGGLKGAGKEPDESFYFTHLEVIHSKETLDLAVDPPPDLWIEVDNRASSAGKLPLYAALGVTEVWRYRPRRRQVWLGWLENGAYAAIEESHWLPGLTRTTLIDLVNEAQSRVDSVWDAWLDAWIAERAPYFAERRAALRG
jgi:Uma2 family endonuclease